MKVKCIAKTGNQLPSSYINERLTLGVDQQFSISLGVIYTVYALTTAWDRVWYYIADDVYVDYPVWYPAPLFEVVDGRVSEYWQCQFYSDSNKLIMAIPEWIEDRYFYDRLTDGESEAVRIFTMRKEQIDAE